MSTVGTNQPPCRTSNVASDFTGSWSRTYSGKTCQRWDSQTPHGHGYSAAHFIGENYLSSASNFCRDPNNSGRLWCFTTDPHTVSEPCDIPMCRTGN